MSLTPSTMLPLGESAPPFSLLDPDGKLVSLDDFADARAVVVAFICNHCPYVKHLKPALAKFAVDYADRGVAFVAINSNDVDAYPADAPDKMKEDIDEFDYVFPYLFDPSQDVAKAYRAACTPDFFLFDRHRKLVYRGQLDASRPGNGIPVTGEDLRAAADAVLEGRPVTEKQIPSIGCNIKWKPGNEPDYA
jgi:thiol-disulfide isomerase/thioredoxin